jgi:hypothetical protein
MSEIPDLAPGWWGVENNWLPIPWRATEDDSIGGWCVVRADDTRTPAEGGIVIAAFVTEAVAEHITMVHNRWLAGELPNVP